MKVGYILDYILPTKCTKGRHCTKNIYSVLWFICDVKLPFSPIKNCREERIEPYALQCGHSEKARHSISWKPLYFIDRVIR